MVGGVREVAAFEIYCRVLRPDRRGQIDAMAHVLLNAIIEIRDACVEAMIDSRIDRIDHCVTNS